MIFKGFMPLERYFREVYLPGAMIQSTTKQNYEVHARKGLAIIGKMPVLFVTKKTIKKLIDDLEEDSRSISAISEVIKILSSMYSFAVENRHTFFNPCRGMRPRKKRSKAQIYKKEEVEQVLDLLKEKPAYMWLTAFIAINTGMRRGEILGLQWEEVNLPDGTITINQAYKQPLIGAPFLDPPKTPSSFRTISIPDSLIAVLKEKEERSGFVVRSPKGAVKPSSFSHMYSDAMKKLGIKKRFHDLRHTHASILLAQGVDVVTVSHRLGHSSPAITLSIYAHLVEGMDKKALEKLDGYFDTT